MALEASATPFLGYLAFASTTSMANCSEIISTWYPIRADFPPGLDAVSVVVEPQQQLRYGLANIASTR